MDNTYLNNDFEYYFSNKFSNEVYSDFSKALRKCALVILKPECLLTNKISEAIDILKEYDFDPIFFKIKTLSQQQVFSLWKYGWANATMARILMNYIVMSFSPCVIIIVKNKSSSLKEPCEFLNTQKGHSYPTESDNISIRYRLGAFNNFLNYIHISDSFNDMVREIAVLYDYKEMLELIEVLKSNRFISLKLIQKETLPYIKNLVFSNPATLFNEYISSFQDNLNDIAKDIKENLYKSLEQKSISNELFLSLMSNNLINWDWNNIVLFSSYIETVDKNKTSIYCD